MKTDHWYFYLHTRRQRLAAFTALLMLALGLILGRHDYDQPHLHVNDEPSWPTTMVSMSGSATNATPSVMTFRSSLYPGMWWDGREA
jgi:hypothetical protein